MQIDRLDGSIDTLDNSWKLSGALSAGWNPTLFGVDLAIAAGVEFDLAELPPATSPSGWVSGRFSVNRFAISLRKDIGVPQPTYALRVQFGELWLQAVTAWITEEGVDPYEVIAIQLGGVTLGDVLEEIVNLAAPTLGFSLEPPWDVLKRIELSRFTLTVDPTHKKVALTYAVDADLLLLKLETIGISYTMGASSKVDLIVTGRFLDKQFTPAKPLAWDVVNDPPPAVPGKGPKLIELRYLGLGQRVRLKDPQPETVAAAIARLREDMPEKPPDSNPLVCSEMVFDGSSGWLIGLDIGVLETVQVALVFSDPRLYGLSIALDGERAGALAGLRFEILYKQLAPGLGMFRIELRIPEAFRHIELGEVSLTLGTIVVEIYTNGNFLIDLGFPHERDYERSFTVQVFPFVGRGGIYFGVLDGATSRRVPAITNGTFSPVLELGIGLAVGVGKEISVGPLSGGAYLELEVIFQGVLGWFHPTGSDTATERYHWAQGIVAIHGKVWGEVDFYVVKASVTLEAYAQATVVFESYRATLFELKVYVDAEAEIEILFVTVSFSFKVDLDLSFTVGSDEQAPWTLAPDQSPRTRTLRAPRRLAAHQRTRVLLAAGESEWSWSPSFPAFPSPRTLTVSMLPTFSIAGAPLSWTATPPPPQATPGWRMAFPLFAANGIAPGARTAAQTTAPLHDHSDPLPAASVVSALLSWSLAALPTGVSESGKVTAGGARAAGRGDDQAVRRAEVLQPRPSGELLRNQPAPADQRRHAVHHGRRRDGLPGTAVAANHRHARRREQPLYPQRSRAAVRGRRAQLHDGLRARHRRAAAEAARRSLRIPVLRGPRVLRLVPDGRARGRAPGRNRAERNDGCDGHGPEEHGGHAAHRPRLLSGAPRRHDREHGGVAGRRRGGSSKRSIPTSPNSSPKPCPGRVCR